MTYDRIHKFLLRSIASRGVIAMPKVKQIINSFTEDVDVTPKDLIKDINEKIRPFQQKIKITNDELTSEEVVVFLSLGYDDATKSQNIFSATELEYFRILLEQIMTTVTRQITGIHAINLVSSMKSSFTKTDAQKDLMKFSNLDGAGPKEVERFSIAASPKLLNVWCQMRYLDKDDANYALGVRAIHEFEGYFLENMPDIIEECCLCKQVVFRGCNCPACGVAIHTLCLNKYLEKLQKWPCCMIDFNQAQLDRLNCIGLSQSVRLRETQETICDETEPLTCSSMDVDDGTQEIIPEISQRITRKRKRPE